MVGRTLVRPEKETFVKSLVEEINKTSIVGIFDVHKLPASALQKIKYQLYDKADIRSIKKSILIRSFENSNKKELTKYVTGQPGLILTDMNPFKLYSVIVKSKSKMSAKAGDVAPYDIEVKAGPTDLMPGPAISTLAKVGLQGKVEGGKIAIARDKVVAKTGDVISSDLASVLNMVGMKPMEVGLTLNALLENGVIYTSDVLFIDEAKTLHDIISAYNHAISLSIESNFATKESVSVMISKAFNEAKVLCVQGNILDEHMIGESLLKAVNEMKGLENKTGSVEVAQNG